MNPILKVIALGTVALAPVAALAEDAALILSAADYARLPDAPEVPGLDDLATSLEAAGFKVTTLADIGAEDAWAAIETFRDDAALADRVLIFAAGHFVHTQRDTWLLTRYVTQPSDLSVGAAAIPLGSLFDIAADHPGQAVVMLAPSAELVTGPGLEGGSAALAPQGVTLIAGAGEQLVDIAESVLLEPGARLREALLPAPAGVEVSGFLSDAVPFLPAAVAVGPQPPAPQADIELAFWNVVVEMGTPEAYEAYLARYPAGRFTPVAKAAVDGAALNAEARAETDEAALGLDRADRQDIQRNLSLLGYDPRGIDGIFGPGSRTAIADWQRDNGFEPSGFVTAEQLNRLSEAGKRRADELAIEAAKRKAEEERLDTQYWRDTGRGGGEPALRAYLDRYPDGLFADVAEARLAEIEAAKRTEAQAAERALWDDVRKKDTGQAYQDYLDVYPNGLFADDARAKIKEFNTDDKDAVVAAAKQEEKEVAGNGVMRLLVETQLKAAGRDPGSVDGRFDKTTRRAIRRFQREQGLPVTGYVTQGTMVRLMAVP